MLSSVKFHLENIRGSPVQVVKHCSLFLQALGMDVTQLWHGGHPQLLLSSPGCPKAAPATGVQALSIAPRQPQECSAGAGLRF